MRMLPLRAYAVILAAFFLPAAARAQAEEKAKPGDVMIEKYLAAETDKLSKKFMDGARTLEEWRQKRQRLYQEYMDMLGLWPIPEKTPLKATVTGQVEAHGVVVEKESFAVRPPLRVRLPRGDRIARRPSGFSFVSRRAELLHRR